jgi:biotin synthase
MFEELGLNVARQRDNGARPRPDNRTGWLEGETPDVIADTLTDSAPPPSLELRLWDPSTQLRFHRKSHVARRPQPPDLGPAEEHAA